MINFDAEVATVVRTTIARSEKYVHLKIVSLFSSILYSENQNLYSYTSNSMRKRKIYFLNQQYPAELQTTCFSIKIYKSSTNKNRWKKLKNNLF